MLCSTSTHQTLNSVYSFDMFLKSDPLCITCHISLLIVESAFYDLVDKHGMRASLWLLCGSSFLFLDCRRFGIFPCRCCLASSSDCSFYLPSSQQGNLFFGHSPKYIITIFFLVSLFILILTYFLSISFFNINFIF